MHEGTNFAAAGYCGSGTVWSRWFGKKAAEIILNFEQKVLFTIFHLGKFLQRICGLCL